MLYKRVVRTSCFIREFIRVVSSFCINVLYACCIFPKEQNQLITGKRKPEEKCESSQKKNLRFSVLEGYTALIQCYPQQLSTINNSNS